MENQEKTPRVSSQGDDSGSQIVPEPIEYKPPRESPASASPMDRKWLPLSRKIVDIESGKTKGESISIVSDSFGKLEIHYQGKKLLDCLGARLDTEDAPASIKQRHPSFSEHVCVLQNTREYSSGMRLYEEVSVKGERAEVNIGWRIPAVAFKDAERHFGTYSWAINIHDFGDYTYKVYYGRPIWPPKIATGLVRHLKDSETPLYENIRSVYLEKGDEQIFLDFDPEGVQHHWPTNQRFIPTRLNTESGIFEIYRSDAQLGVDGVMKFRVYGNCPDVQYDLHPVDTAWYSLPFQVAAALDFGTNDPQKLEEGFIPVGTSLYTEKSGIGFVSNDGLTVGDNGTNGKLLRDFVNCTSGSRTFQMDLRNGYYLVNIRCGNQEEAIGPFEIICCGKKIASGLVIPPGEIVEHSCRVQVRDNCFTLTLSGDRGWVLNALIIHPLQNEQEDFFTRPYFVGEPYKVKGTRPPDAPSSLPAVKQTPSCDDAGWYSGHLVNWATSEYPCGYVTSEDAERIIKGFKEMGHSVIIRGGMHYRYNHQELYDHYAEQTRIVTEIAHKYGMKVVEHMEMVVITLTGYERLGTPGHCDMLLRDARSGKMTPWFCINNPDLQKMLTDYLVEYQRQTNVDGYMIDEMSIYGQYNCGCRHCRRRFKEDTGLSIPFDSADPFYDSSQNFMRWNKWKNERAVMIKREIKDAIREVRPDVKILSYSSAISYRYGSGNMQDHNESYVDFTGIEFMPRAFFAAYPACLIDMKTNLSFARPLGHPTWIIPYIPGSPNSTAFAEAICMMGLHIPWYMNADTKVLKKTARFKYRLDAENSKIHTRLAVLYLPIFRLAKFTANLRWFEQVP